MNCHIHIKQKITLRNWLRNKSESTKQMLYAFDAEYEEIKCECKHEEYLQNGDLFMNVKTHQVFLGKEEIKMRPKVFMLLEYIFRRKGHCVPYEEILSNLWGKEHENDLHYIRVFARELRVSLNDSEQKIIKTIPRVGLIMNTAPNII